MNQTFSTPMKYAKKKNGPPACVGCHKDGHCLMQACFHVLPTWCPNQEEGTDSQNGVFCDKSGGESR